MTISQPPFHALVSTATKNTIVNTIKFMISGFSHISTSTVSLLHHSTAIISKMAAAMLLSASVYYFYMMTS